MCAQAEQNKEFIHDILLSGHFQERKASSHLMTAWEDKHHEQAP